MVKKLFTIAGIEITLRLTDPMMLAFAFGLPLVLAALINLAFGDLVLSRGISDRSIPVGIVNQDRGGRWGNFGDVFIAALMPLPEAPTSPDGAPFRLFDVQTLEDPGQAQRMVEREELQAALLIPPDFSVALDAGHATLLAYINGGDSVKGMAFKSAAEGLAHMISTVAITLRTTVQGLFPYPQLRARAEFGGLSQTMADLALMAAMPESNPIRLQRVRQAAAPTGLDLTHYLAAAIAIMFAGFAALAGSAAILQEKTQGTLQRMVITPTRPSVILGGKAAGTYLSGLIQLGVLVAGMAALEQIIVGGSGQGARIDLLGLCLLILSLVAAATGTAVAIAGLARTYVQAVNYGGAALLLMGLVGGVFFPVSMFPRPFDLLSRVTFHYWAMDGYLRLALGDGALSVLPHALILVAMGTLFFMVGNWLLRRHIGWG